ncbi:MAG: TetR/AcrR family transcriptional regulator [Proteobacteria bacterium]|nr:TetR/AcrR family transcriptional regulator [Pseudomonadota bacterium]
MNYKEFQQIIHIFQQNKPQEAFAENRKDIRIKKEKTVVKNLARIFEATLKIGNEKGFHAMSMRDLSDETGLSMGALYAYFTSKDNLLVMLQRNGRDNFQKMLETCIKEDADAIENLRMLVKTHLFMSEDLQPWFYFTYMEGKNLNKTERKTAVENELYTDKIIADILEKGQEESLFKPQDHQLTAALIKAMLNDWYLKRWKYAKRNISVDDYADYVLSFVESFCVENDR